MLMKNPDFEWEPQRSRRSREPAMPWYKVIAVVGIVISLLLLYCVGCIHLVEWLVREYMTAAHPITLR